MNEMERQRLIEQEGVTFHYSREEYFKNHPEVEKLHNGEMIPEKGLFKVLVKAPGGKFLLITIGILLAVIVILGVLHKPNQDFIGKVNMNLAAFAFEDTVYVTLKFDPSDDGTAVAATVTALTTDNQTVAQRELSGNLNDKELLLRTTFNDFEIYTVKASIKMNGQEKLLSVVVTR